MGFMFPNFELLEYERRRSCDDAKSPPLVCFITGKGPTKAHYLDVMARRRWRHVQICTPWLEPEDYPRLLGECNAVPTQGTSPELDWNLFL